MEIARWSLLVCIVFLSSSRTSAGPLVLENELLALNNLVKSLDPKQKLNFSAQDLATACHGNYRWLTCSPSGNVMAIDLLYQPLGGELPSPFVTLPYLTRLVVRHCSLWGTLPPTMSSLSRLRYLDLSDNYLKGRFTLNLTAMPSITYAILGGNYFTSAIIPASPSPLLSDLSLRNNWVTNGALPSVPPWPSFLNLFGNPVCNSSGPARSNASCAWSPREFCMGACRAPALPDPTAFGGSRSNNCSCSTNNYCFTLQFSTSSPLGGFSDALASYVENMTATVFSFVFHDNITAWVTSATVAGSSVAVTVAAMSHTANFTIVAASYAVTAVLNQEWLAPLGTPSGYAPNVTCTPPGLSAVVRPPFVPVPPRGAPPRSPSPSPSPPPPSPAAPSPAAPSPAGSSKSWIIAVAVAVSVALLLLLTLGLFIYCCWWRRRESSASGSQSFMTAGSKQRLVKTETGESRRGLSRSSSFNQKLQESLVRWYSLEDMAQSTDSWSEAQLLGQGGYGKVYLGMSPFGAPWAVKRVEGRATQRALLDFRNEIELISRTSHRNLVKLYGYCDENGEQILVYEYVPNGNLRQHLRPSPGSTFKPMHLSFLQRLEIAVGAAEGLRYLHNFTNPSVVHRDIKCDNILLDEELQAKVADFGFFKSTSGAAASGDGMSTRVLGTPGYVDPEYYYTCKVTTKCDVYSFGVVLWELLTGKPPIMEYKEYESGGPGGEEGAKEGPRAEEGEPAFVQLPKWGAKLLEEGRVDGLADAAFRGEFEEEAFREMARVAEMCTKDRSKQRPEMSEVALRLLEIQTKVRRTVQEEGDAISATPHTGNSLRISVIESAVSEAMHSTNQRPPLSGPLEGR